MIHAHRWVVTNRKWVTSDTVSEALNFSPPVELA